MSANQDKIDSLTQKADKILKEVEALKNQPGAEQLDFSKLDAALQNIDDVNEDTTEPTPDEPASPAEGDEQSQG